MVTERLKSLKERFKLTVAKWSNLSGIPEETISKILQGATKNPTFDTVYALVTCLGLTLDEFLGIEKKPDPSDSTKVIEAIKGTYEKSISELKESQAKQMESKEERIKDLKQSRNLFAVIALTLIILLVVVIIVDLTHGHMGYIQY